MTSHQDRCEQLQIWQETSQRDREEARERTIQEKYIFQNIFQKHFSKIHFSKTSTRQCSWTPICAISVVSPSPIFNSCLPVRFLRQSGPWFPTRLERKRICSSLVLIRYDQIHLEATKCTTKPRSRSFQAYSGVCTRFKRFWKCSN